MTDPKDADTIVPPPFADAALAAIRTLQVFYRAAGNSPALSHLSAANVLVALLDNGGPGWLERLIAAQPVPANRLAAQLGLTVLREQAMPEGRCARVTVMLMTKEPVEAIEPAVSLALAFEDGTPPRLS